MRSSDSDICKFLSDMRLGIDKHSFIPVCRKKNITTLTTLGITWEDAKEEIYALTPQEYISGPDVDRDRPSSDMFWKFKKTILGKVIYIKLKVEYLSDGSVKVVSFHLDGI